MPPTLLQFTFEECIYRRYASITFVHGAMGRRIDPSWGGPIELFLVLV